MTYNESAEGSAPNAEPVNPTDPVFETQAELEAWVRHFDRIRRVTLAHLHLKGE